MDGRTDGQTEPHRFEAPELIHHCLQSLMEVWSKAPWIHCHEGLALHNSGCPLDSMYSKQSISLLMYG